MEDQMRWLSTITAVAFVAAGALGCAEKELGPNIQDPNGPKVQEVLISYCVEIGQTSEGNIQVVCYPSAALLPGNSAQLSARALSTTDDITTQCTWVWRSNSSFVTIRVNQPSRTAIVTKNPFNGVSGQQITVTATCNGVSGSYNIQ